jgi:LysM repeat protein
MSKITITPLSFPQGALTLPLGKKKPLFSGGIAQWTEVRRPRRRSMTEFEAEEPLKYSFDVVLDAFPDGDVEPLIPRVMGWAARMDLPYQPTLLRVSGPIVYPQLTYFLSKCDQLDESMEFNSAGRICRQFLDLEITEYVAPDLVIQTPTPAQAAQQRAQTQLFITPGGKLSRILAASGSTAQRTYVVAAGDTLWSIAARLLGKGQRWSEIAEMNSVRDPRTIRVGQVLKVPNA